MSELRLAALAAVLFAVGCSHRVQQRAEAPARGDMSDQTYRIGRFEISVPEGLALKARHQSIYRVSVAVTDVPARDMPDVWRVRVEQLRKPAARSFDLLPDTPAAWSMESAETPDLMRLNAAKAVPGGILAVSRLGDAGKQEGNEKLVRNVINAYVPESRYGFFLERGAIVSEPGQNESTRLLLNQPGLKEFELLLETQTVRTGTPLNRLSDVDQVREATEGNKGSFTVLHSGLREAASLPGLEEKISIADTGKSPVLRFTWKYGGEPQRADAPEIVLMGSALAANQAKLEQVWETAVRSLRRLPMTAGDVR